MRCDRTMDVFCLQGGEHGFLRHIIGSAAANASRNHSSVFPIPTSSSNCMKYIVQNGLLVCSEIGIRISSSTCLALKCLNGMS